jgi:hypothetical protein
MGAHYFNQDDYMTLYLTPFSMLTGHGEIWVRITSTRMTT